MTKMKALFERQGVDDWGQYAEAKNARRNKNLAAAHEVLTRNGIPYEELETELFRVHKDDGTVILYHPPTGEWKDEQHTGYGIRNLVRHIKGQVI